jgi:hypothetical protein
MLSQSCIRFEPRRQVVPPGEGHFIVGIVDTVVAQAADGNAVLSFFPGEVLLETFTPMKFAGNEVMKGQGTLTSAKGTKAKFLAFEVCHPAAVMDGMDERHPV